MKIFMSDEKEGLTYISRNSTRLKQLKNQARKANLRMKNIKRLKICD